ncbi:class I SAM-dependent methyltransferase [Brevundimonas sp. VNH65]|uniref:class I SAM-dependent methyltransferase n=1 Tax=Brevundimonas sp. VNH65 TaxID=3400917 RepID=UPI003C02BC34
MRLWFRSDRGQPEPSPEAAPRPDAQVGQAAATSHWDGMYETITRSAWTQNPIVGRAIYERMTDEAGFWLDWVFTRRLKPVDRLLAIGCGDGVHELFLARAGHAKAIDAFDASPVAIERAGETARAEGLSIDFSVRLFEEFAAAPGPDDVYDAVLFSGSLHHVTDIEGVLSAVRRVLKPGGRVIVNEYCGACYQLYSRRQVDIVDRVLASTPAAFRASDRLEMPTIDMIMAGDPTEGVRASLIPLLVPAYFEPEYERFLGGGLLHPIFTCLNATKVNDGSPESQAYVEMLVRMDDELTRAGALGHDFMFGIYRNR